MGKLIYIGLKSLLVFGLGIFIFTFALFLRNTFVSRWPDNTLPSQRRLPYEEVNLLSKDKLPLKGWLIFKNSQSPTVILCHGLGTNKSDLLSIAEFIYEAGFNVFLFDFRAHGESKGRIRSFGYLEQKDLEGAVDYLSGLPGLENKNLGIFGLSLGAATSIVVAARDPRIKAVVSDSAYSNLYLSMVHHAKMLYSLPRFPFNVFLRAAYFLRFGCDPKMISPCDAVSRISPRPIFIIGGEKDKTDS
ncbi:MAG: alpha/beta fold hydrolase [Candidatus Omnitrophota bacterium]